jgi:hypothetical protein
VRPVRGADNLMSRLSRQRGILNISQLCRPPRPGTGIALLSFLILLKPTWTCGMKLWGSASTSNGNSRALPKTPRVITDAAWYAPHEAIRKVLQTPSAKDEISRHSKRSNELYKCSRPSEERAIATTPADRSAHQTQCSCNFTY